MPSQLSVSSQLTHILARIALLTFDLFAVQPFYTISVQYVSHLQHISAILKSERSIPSILFSLLFHSNSVISTMLRVILFTYNLLSFVPAVHSGYVNNDNEYGALITYINRR